MRGKANWIVKVYWDESEEVDTYGPYTQAKAEKVERQIERWFERRRKANDEDNVDGHAIAHPIEKWRDHQIEKGVARPNCPTCGEKMCEVTHFQYSNIDITTCRNRECADYNVEVKVVEQDGRWVIVEERS